MLLDLALPDGDGLRRLPRAARASSTVPIIMLTARGTVTDRVVGLELGADDYVVKPFAAGRGDLAHPRDPAAHRVARPSPGRPASGWSAICDSTAAPGARGSASIELSLTRKEFDLLARLAAEPGRVVSRETLMSDVWDENWFGSTKTLDVHIAACGASSATTRPHPATSRRSAASASASLPASAGS